MKELISSCKKAIEEERCYGCTALEIPEYVGNPNCKFSKQIYVQQRIDEIQDK